MIRLTNMEFYAYHGCLESERRDGNLFRVDLEYDYQILEAAETDDLYFAVDYSSIYEIIKREMAVPANLLESLAVRILRAILYEFKQLSFAQITVTKQNPPIGGKADSASVTINSTQI